MRAQAFDVDVQLVLASCIRRIDREAHGAARYGVSDDIGQAAAGIPRESEIIRRTRLGEHRALDPGNASGGDEQKVRAAFAVREHRVTRISAPLIREDDLHAGSRVMPGNPIDHTMLLDDLLQGMPIRAMCRR